MNKIQVVSSNAYDRSFLLRLFLTTRDNEVIRFETKPIYSKREADYRAVSLSSAHGFERDELPTHPKIDVDPSPEK